MFEIGILQIAMCVFGVVVGIVFGALPGMTATMAIAIFLPLTYAYDMGTSLYLLLGLYVGGITGGLIPAILINIPGTPSSITTCFDGYPMAKKGEGAKALKIGIVASLFGGIVSLICLWLFTPVLASIAIKFSAVEKFLIILFALTVIAALSKGNMLRGLFAGILGVFVSLIGMFGDNNQLRMVPAFLDTKLRDGFALLPVIIGLFAIAQMFQEAESGMKRAKFQVQEDSKEKFSFKVFKGQSVNLMRSSMIGTFMGILPGVGGSAASILAYSQAKNFSKHPEKFGTGAEEGLVASESANNGLTGGALIPLLSLGIPGDSTTAVLIGAFMLQGIAVGPLFIKQNPTVWNTILVSLLIANLIMFVVMFFAIKYISQIIKIPKSRLYPAIIIMTVVGSYAINNGVMFDVWTMIIFGVVGYLFAKIGLPSAPFLIGFILGGDLEQYFIDALKGSNGNLAIFFTRGPIAWAIWLMIIASVAYAIYDNHKGNAKQASE